MAVPARPPMIVQSGEVADPAQPLEQRALPDGDLTAQHGDRQQRYSAHMLGVTERGSSDGPREQDQDCRARASEHDCRAAKHAGRPGDAGGVSRARRFRDLAHAAALDAEACEALDEIRDRAVDAEQPDSRRAKEEGRGLGPYHPERNGHDRGAADDGGRPQDLRVALFRRRSVRLLADVHVHHAVCGVRAGGSLGGQRTACFSAPPARTAAVRTPSMAATGIEPASVRAFSNNCERRRLPASTE